MKRIAIAGATGMVGGYALRWAAAIAEQLANYPRAEPLRPL